MIDKHGLIVDQTGDGGDSCNFTCTLLALNPNPFLLDGINKSAPILFWNSGNPVRHPFQEKIIDGISYKNHNNPKNFTRDQAIPLMHTLPPTLIIRFIRENSFFFPNTERDIEGSTKHPYPHWFINDKGEREFSWFDYADIMTPDFRAMCLFLAGEKPSFMLMKTAKYLCMEAIKDHCQKASTDKSYVDFKQLYFTAKTLGLHREFAVRHPWGLELASEKYFVQRRGLITLHQAFMDEFEREGLLS